MSMAGLSQKNKLDQNLAGFFWMALDWLYPPHCCNCDERGFVLCDKCFSEITVLHGSLCQHCGYPIKRGHLLCDDCKNNPPFFTEMRSWAPFSGVVRKALLSLKYQRNLALGPILAKPLVEMLKQLNWPIDLIVPIPISRSHQRQRGYNPHSSPFKANKIRNYRSALNPWFQKHLRVKP